MRCGVRVSECWGRYIVSVDLVSFATDCIFVDEKPRHSLFVEERENWDLITDVTTKTFDVTNINRQDEIKDLHMSFYNFGTLV